jgi:hypothetical protein
MILFYILLLSYSNNNIVVIQENDATNVTVRDYKAMRASKPEDYDSVKFQKIKQ